MLDEWHQIEAIGKKNDMSTRTGIRRWSILNELLSIHMPRSYATDLMHNVLCNLVPNITNMLLGRSTKDGKKTTNTSTSSVVVPPTCQIQKRDLTAIGNSQERARATIPASLGQAPRRIDNYLAGYKAMEVQAWLIRDAIPLLEHHVNLHPYLENLMLLKQIYCVARSWHISRAELKQLKLNCYRFVQSYQELYYDGEPDRMHVMGINVHYILHLRTYLQLQIQLANMRFS